MIVVTLKEIAARCDCSVATVSKALNGMPDISPKTAKQIRQIAEEMGYMPNAAARALRTNQSHTIGLLWFLHDESIWTHSHFNRIADGIQRVTEAAGYDLSPINCESEALKGHYTEYCRHRGYDGVILMSAAIGDDDLDHLVNSNVPLVSLDRNYPGRSDVSSDYTGGMKLLVDYIVSKGHHKIAYIHGESESLVTESRVQGFKRACKDAGIQVPDSYLLESRYRDVEKTSALTRQLLALPERPTCIIFPDDTAAMGGLRVLHQEGVRVPEDMSVAGYDGIELATLLPTPLTTISQDCETMGRYVGEEILKAIGANDHFEPQRIVVPVKLLEGSTVAEIR